MARGVNKVILVGNCGGDPEVRQMPNGGTVANVTIATSESWTDKNSGQKQERTEWHRVVFYNQLADIVASYVKKGSQLYIEGSLRTRKWQDKDGQDRYTTEIVAEEMQMLGGRPAQNDGGQPASAQQRAAEQQGRQSRQAQQQPPPANNFDNFNDDIPF